jgi:soluble lytic murein transglycosylase-like protein
MFLVFILPIFLPATDIVVKQDKKGKITISNVSKYTSKTRRPVRSMNFLRPKRQTVSIPAPYLEKIRILSYKYQLRQDLIIAVVRAESSFNPRAVSKKGAVGLMQLMRSTAQQYGVKNRFNADQNLEAGVKHLKHLYQKYGRNLPITLAAYNAGEEAVKKHRGVPPYRETRNYIRRVYRYMGLSYTSSFSLAKSTKIYKYVSKEGKIVISDSPPSGAKGKIKIFN